MRIRTLAQDLEVSAPGLGCMSMSANYGPPGERWLLAQKRWIVPVPGTTKLHRLDENLGARTAGLTDRGLKGIDEAASQLQRKGDRLPNWRLK